MTDAQAATERRWGLTLLVLAIAAVGPTDVPPLGPALPAIAGALDVPAARAGLVVTAYAAPGAVAAPLIGSLADRYGRRRVVVPSLVLYGVFGVAAGVAPSFGVVLALRVLQGIVGGSIITSLAFTVVGDVFSGARRNAVLGWASAVASLAAAGAPAVGGALASVAWNWVFAVYLLPLVLGVVAFGALPESGGGATRERSYLGDVFETVPLGRAAAVYGAGLVVYALFFGGVLTAVPFVLADAFGLGPGVTGAVVTGGSLLGAGVAALNGRFARYATDGTLLSLGVVGAGAGLVVVGMAGSTAGVAAGVGVFGLGYGLFQPSQAAALSTLGPERVRGGLMSLRTSVILGGQAVGPLLFTVPAATVGYRPPLLATGAAALVVGAVATALAAR